MFGYGWRTTFDVNLAEDGDGNIIIYDTSGTGSYFLLNGDGTYQRSYGNYSQITKNPDNTYTIMNKYGITIEYGAAGRITSVTDRNQNTLQFVFNPGVTGGTYIEDSTSRRITLTLDANNRIVSARDPAGRVIDYEYDTDGNLVTITDPKENNTYYIYDTEHNITELTNVNGHKTFFGYDAQDRAIMNSQENDLNKETLDYQEDGITVVTDALNNQATYQFNGYGLEVSRTDAVAGTVTTAWDRYMNRTSVTDESGNTTTFNYDLKGNLTKVTDAQGNVTILKYTPDFNLISRSTDALGNITSYTYDEAGNLLIVTDALGNTQQMTYDDAGKVLTVIDALENVTSFQYDAHGYPAKTIDAQLNETTIACDVAGNILTTITPENEQTMFAYDELNRLTTTTYPDASTLKKTGFLQPVQTQLITTTKASSQTKPGRQGFSTKSFVVITDRKELTKYF